MSKLVFVYGSLKRGFHNHGLLNNPESEFIGECDTPPEFTMYDLGSFPAIVPEGETPIQGEVFRVSGRVFGNLDMLEGFPSFYNRKLINTPYGEAWVYFIPEATRMSKVVASGVWQR